MGMLFKDPILNTLCSYAIPYLYKVDAERTNYQVSRTTFIQENRTPEVTVWLADENVMDLLIEEAGGSRDVFLGSLNLRGPNAYLVTNYGLIREVNHVFFHNSMLPFAKTEMGVQHVRAECLIESYRRKDILYFTPEDSIKNLLYFAENNVRRRKEKKDAFDERRQEQKLDLLHRFTNIKLGNLSPEQDKLLDKVLGFDVTHDDRDDADFCARYQQYERDLRKELRLSGLGEFVLDGHIQNYWRQCPTRPRQSQL